MKDEWDKSSTEVVIVSTSSDYELNKDEAACIFLGMLIISFY